MLTESCKEAGSHTPDQYWGWTCVFCSHTSQTVVKTLTISYKNTDYKINGKYVSRYEPSTLSGRWGVDASCNSSCPGGHCQRALYCALCGEWVVTYAYDHKYKETKIKTPATCFKDGLEVDVCSNCNAEYNPTVISARHDYGAKVFMGTGILPTGVMALVYGPLINNYCTAPRIYSQTCSKCGNTIYSQTTAPSQSHSLSANYVYDYSMKCEQNGAKYKYCTNWINRREGIQCLHRANTTRSHVYDGSMVQPSVERVDYPDPWHCYGDMMMTYLKCRDCGEEDNRPIRIRFGMIWVDIGFFGGVSYSEANQLDAFGKNKRKHEEVSDFNIFGWGDATYCKYSDCEKDVPGSVASDMAYTSYYKYSISLWWYDIDKNGKSSTYDIVWTGITDKENGKWGITNSCHPLLASNSYYRENFYKNINNYIIGYLKNLNQSLNNVGAVYKPDSNYF